MTTATASRPRRAAALVAAALSTLALTGCSLNSPTATMLEYAPADGVEADGEQLAVRDLLLVSQGQGASAVVSGSLVNQSDEQVTATVTVDGETLSPEITLEPNGTASLAGGPDGTQGERLIVPALDATAGQYVPVRIDAGSEALSANAPVLLPQGTYEMFADDAGGTVEPAPTSEDDH